MALVNQSYRKLTPGIYAPIPSFFLPQSEDLDIPSFEAHLLRVVSAGVSPLIAGTMGEAIHLSHSERVKLIQVARKVLDDASFTHVPIIAGTGAGSTRETIELTLQAAAAGADYAIVIASGYFAGALANDREALKAFWLEIANKSPIPVMIYNYPSASGGIDLDSDLIIELAKECPNICGVKLTCGNVGKLTRIADAVAAPSFTALHPRKISSAPFLVLGGFTDFIVPSTYANGHGAITGLANLAPHSIVHLFKLAESSRQDPSILREAQRVQGIVARADFTISKTSIAGMKYLLQRVCGYGGLPRKPLLEIGPEAAQALWDHSHTSDIFKLESALTGKGVEVDRPLSPKHCVTSNPPT